MHRFLLLALILMLPLAAERRQVLTPQDKEQISYIISTLSGKSAFSLMFLQSSLEKAGKETESVHPLAFLGYVFSNPELKEKVTKILPFVWKRFKNDFAKSLNKEAANGGMTEAAIANFASQVGLPESEVAGYVQARDWNGLFTALEK